MPRLRLAQGRIGCAAPRLAAARKRVAWPYTDPRWKKLVAAIIAQRGRRCESCGRQGCRLFGDHVVEIKDGGAPFDEANVRLLCGSCHSTKTAAARRARAGLA